MAKRQVVLVRRDTREKQSVALDDLATTLNALLVTIQNDMLEAARATMAANTVVVEQLDDLYARVQANAGFSLAGWCGSAECEAQVKTASRATIRCIPFDQPDDAGSCIVCSQKATSQVVMARAY